MNPDNFLLNTDYPIDKVLDTFSGSFTALARYGAFSPRRTTSSEPHNVGDWGLILGSYSLDNLVWYPFGVTRANISGSEPTFQDLEVTGYCNTTDIAISASNNTASSATVYWAIVLLARE